MPNERVSDERLAGMISRMPRIIGGYGDPMPPTKDIQSALIELQQRRASVVTQEMVERIAAAVDSSWREKGGLNCTEVCAIIRSAALSVVSHKTGDGETQAALPITDETQGVKREVTAWRSRPTGTLYWSYTELRPEGPSAHLFTVEPLFSLSQLESVEHEVVRLRKLVSSSEVERYRSCSELLARSETAEASLAAMREALTPSGDTKAAYMGEFTIAVERQINDDDEVDDETENASDPYEHITVPWTTIKEIMAAIAARAGAPS